MKKENANVVSKKNNNEVVLKSNELVESVKDVWSKVRKMLSTKTIRIYKDMENELTETRMMRKVYEDELLMRQKELRELTILQDIKDCKGEIKRLKKEEEKLEFAIVTTLNNELYDVKGKTLFEKVNWIRDNE